MADLKQEFEAAATRVKGLPDKPDNDTLLKLYALYKQGSEGDVRGKRPGLMDMVGRAKHSAWAGLKGTGKDEARQEYIDLVEKLLAKSR